MSKITLNDILNKVAVLNAKKSTITTASKDETTESKLNKYALAINNAQTSIEKAYNNAMGLRKNICNSFAAAYIGKCYYIKANKELSKLKTILTLLESLTFESGSLDEMLNYIARLLAMLLQNRNDVNALNELKNILGVFETKAKIINNNKDYEITDNNGYLSISAKAKYPKYIITPNNENTMTILYGKIIDSSMIAQETPIYIYSYNNDTETIYVTAPNYKIVNLKFTKQSYSPFKIWPFNKIKKSRYQSAEYEVENEDAEDEDDTTMMVSSILYINGSHFKGGVFNKISNTVGDSYKLKFIKVSNKKNSLSNTIKVLTYFDNISTDIELVYDDESDINAILNRKSDSISDSIDVIVNINTNSNFIKTTGNLIYDSEESGVYFDEDTNTDIPLVTAYSGTLTVKTDSDDDSSQIPALAYIYKCDVYGNYNQYGSYYKVILKPDINDTTSTVIYQSEDVASAAAMASATRTYVGTRSNIVPELSSSDKIAASMNLLGSLDLDGITANDGYSAYITALYDMLKNLLLSGYDSLEADVNSSITNITRILYSYSTFNTCLTTDLPSWNEDYNKKLTEAYTTAYSDITSDSNFKIDDATTYKSYIELIEKDITTVNDETDDLLVDSLVCFNELESLYGSLSPMFKLKSVTTNYSETLDIFNNVITGKTDTIIALVSTGTVFVPLSFNKSYSLFIKSIQDLVVIDDYYIPYMYLLKDYYNKIRKMDSSDTSIKYIKEQYYKILNSMYNKHLFTYSIINKKFRTDREEILYNIDMYKVPITENGFNSFYLCSDVLTVSEGFIEFNTVDIEEAFDILTTTKLNSSGNTYSYTKKCSEICTQWKPIIYKVLSQYSTSTYITIFTKLINIYAHGNRQNINLRDLFFIETVRQVIFELVKIPYSDIKNIEANVIDTMSDIGNALITLKEFPAYSPNESINVSVGDTYENSYNAWITKLNIYVDYYNFNNNILDGFYPVMPGTDIYPQIIFSIKS